MRGLAALDDSLAHQLARLRLAYSDQRSELRLRDAHTHSLNYLHLTP